MFLPIDNEQSINEYMFKFKGRSGMKQSFKSKLEFKFRFRCSSQTGYFYQMNMYLGKKQTSEFNLGIDKEVVLQLPKPLEKFFYAV